MKKGLFLSVMLFAVFVFGNCVPALAIFADHDAFVLAKAVKLGRGNSYSVAADPKLNTDLPGSELEKGECEKNSDCSGNKRCVNNKCVDYCYNISCIAGYTTEETSNGCCCVSLCSDNCAVCSSSGKCTQCNSGYTLSNGRCFPTSDGPEPKCGAYKYGSCSYWYCEGDYTYTNGKCVKTVSCSGNYHPSKEVCESGKGVEKCDRSWEKPYSDSGCWVILRCKEGFGSNQQGQCVKTVSCSGRTPEKSIQADGSIKCSCNSTSCGANAKCIRHPNYNANTLQNNYSYCVCNSGYYDTGSSCAACPTNCTECSSGSVCTACAKGYELSSGKCVAQTNTVSTCPPYTTKSSDGCCCIPD